MTRGAAVVLALGALASGRAPAQRADPALAIAEVPFPLAVAPDGRRVAVVGPEANLAVLDVVAGRTRTLTSKPDWPELVLDAAFSPDGTRLAYAWHNERDFDDLRIIGADGAGQRILFRDSAIRSISVKDWSPDGRHVLAVLLGYDSTTRIALVPAAGGTPRILREVDTTLHGPPGRMLFSPDGRSIAYDAGAKSPPWPHDLYLMAVDGGDPARIVRHGSDDRLIGWAPDGAAIAFASDRSGTVDLWRLPLSGGTPELLRRDVGRMTPLGLGPDGSYYFAAASCACQLQVVRLDPRTGRLDEGADTIGPALRWSGVHWSPDGRYLAYVAPEPGVQLAGGRSRGSWAIVVRSVESGEERRIHADLSAVHQLRPRWSPDGRFLLLEGWDVRAYPAEVAYAVAVETGEVAPLFRSESLWGWMFDWTTWSAGGGCGALHGPDRRLLRRRVLGSGVGPASDSVPAPRAALGARARRIARRAAPCLRPLGRQPKDDEPGGLVTRAEPATDPRGGDNAGGHQPAGLAS